MPQTRRRGTGFAYGLRGEHRHRASHTTVSRLTRSLRPPAFAALLSNAAGVHEATNRTPSAPRQRGKMDTRPCKYGFCYSIVGLSAQGLSNSVRVSNVYGTAFLEIAVRGTRDPRRCGTTPSASKGRRGARASSHSPPRVHKAHLRLPFKYKILCSPSRLSNHPRLRVESEAAV